MSVTTEPRVDAYIAAAAPFAQPILRHLRAQIHAACPDSTEAIKWGMPMFLYCGQILCNMAAFKAHASFGVWLRGDKAPKGDQEERSDGMGQFGKITSVADLPPPVLIEQAIAQAMARIEAGAKMRQTVTPKPPRAVPNDLTVALDANPAARLGFDSFAPGQKREYIEWVEEAKRPETRGKRIEQTVAQSAERKTRNWKYANC